MHLCDKMQTVMNGMHEPWIILSLKLSIDSVVLIVSEVEKLKGILLQQDRGDHQVDNPSHELKVAKQEAAQAQESLKVMTCCQSDFTGWMNEVVRFVCCQIWSLCF